MANELSTSVCPTIRPGSDNPVAVSTSLPIANAVEKFKGSRADVDLVSVDGAAGSALYASAVEEIEGKGEDVDQVFVVEKRVARDLGSVVYASAVEEIEAMARTSTWRRWRA